MAELKTHEVRAIVAKELRLAGVAASEINPAIDHWLDEVHRGWCVVHREIEVDPCVPGEEPSDSGRADG